MDFLWNDLKSIEAEDRFAFDSPVFLISIITAYLVFVYTIGPRFMKNRRPYKLKGLISIYNIIQVLSCIYLVTRIWNLTSWGIFNFNKCTFYKPDTPGRKTFDDLTYFTFWLKVFELTDTVLFVLRKKRNQITYLHVFHHSSTITLVYLLLRYYRGNGALYPIFLNSWVHILMYSYYFISNICGPETMKRLLFVKKTITIIQMVQFVCILGQAMLMWRNCKVPVILRAYYCFVVSVIFYGFYDFYKKAYHKSQKVKEIE